MKTKKRLTSLALCLVLCLSLLPVSALAEDEVVIDETNFPDQVFRDYVASECDTDGNGSLSTAEIRRTAELDVYSEGISSLKGVEYFTELEELDCDSNLLTSLDVSQNRKLVKLYCKNNRLTSLNVSENAKLDKLECDDNRLKTIDITNCRNLNYFSCTGNSIKELDIRGTSLTYLVSSWGLIWDQSDPAYSVTVSINHNSLGFHRINDYDYYDWDDDEDYTPPSDDLLRVDLTTAIQFGNQEKPQITKQPKDVCAADGKTVSFSLTASGKDLHYRWVRSSPGDYDATILNTTTNKLSITAKKSKSGNLYGCVVGNSGWIMVSKTAKLTIVSKPKITTQPKSISVKAGKKVTFKVKASGGELKYQWYVMKAGTTKWVKMSGKTAATLKLTAKKNMNGYKYKCLVKNKAGSVYSKAVKLTVK